MYLKNEIIKLRALEPEDLDVLFRWENDSELWSVSNAVEPYSKYILKEYIAYSDKTIYEKRQLRLMIVQQSTNQVLGAIDLFDFEPHHSRAGVGILIDTQYRHKGYASMALELLIKYSFDFLHLKQLYAHVMSDNGASRELFCSKGFKHSGTMLNWVNCSDVYNDVELYQLINDK